MRIRTVLPLLPVLLLAACKPAEDSHAQAIIGAVLIDGSGSPPLSNSVVIVGEGRILQAGRHGEVPVSAGSSKIDGGGRFLVPGLVDISPRAGSSVDFRAQGGPTTPEEARARIAALPQQQRGAIHVWPAGVQPIVLEALLDAARGLSIPIAGHPATQAEAQSLVAGGATTGGAAP